ncbi:MAG: hypothetical protein U9Q70_05585, partial [Chloroflexota bacterium]|nr:hypothetical protein [Chloroflexota bacterium]
IGEPVLFSLPKPSYPKYANPPIDANDRLKSVAAHAPLTTPLVALLKNGGTDDAFLWTKPEQIHNYTESPDLPLIYLMIINGEQRDKIARVTGFNYERPQ